jgi:hypothetical protein
MLNAVCDKDPKAWDKALPLILFAYRQVPVSYFGFSPFEMLFGRPVNGPLMLLKKNVLGKANLTSAKHDIISYICQLRETLQSVLSTVQTQSEAQKQASKTWYDKSARSREYSIGQKVLMLMPCLDRPLHAKYFGPYTVTQRLGRVDYIVQTPDRRKPSRLCHVNMLKPYYDCDVKQITALPKHAVLTADSEPPLQNIEAPSSDAEDDLVPVPAPTQTLTAQQSAEMTALKSEFASVFSDTPGRTSLIEHHIALKPGATPVYCHPYRLGPEKANFLKEELQ